MSCRSRSARVHPPCRMLAFRPHAAYAYHAAAGAAACQCALLLARRRKRKDGKLVPGPDRVTPFLGGLVEMVRAWLGLPGCHWPRRTRCRAACGCCGRAAKAHSGAPRARRRETRSRRRGTAAVAARTRTLHRPPPPFLQVMDPYRFWERQKDAANVTNPGYSYNSLFGKMILTVTDAGARGDSGAGAGAAAAEAAVAAAAERDQQRQQQVQQRRRALGSGRVTVLSACRAASQRALPSPAPACPCAPHRLLPADKCRELMAVNDPQRMLMVLHPSAKTILGANNLAFLHGPEHKAMRKSFVSLFTRKALSTYTELQVGAGRLVVGVVGRRGGASGRRGRRGRSGGRAGCTRAAAAAAALAVEAGVAVRGSCDGLPCVPLAAAPAFPLCPASRPSPHPCQDGIIRRHLAEWMKRPEFREMRDDVRWAWGVIGWLGGLVV